MTSQACLPFRGLSGWFSCSVSPAVVQLWDHYGGTLVGEDEADYLFSDDANAKDTVRVYETQQDVAVFHSSWIHKVIQNSSTVHDVPLGQHLVLPHYLFPRETGSPRTTTRCIASHTSLTTAGSVWRNSRAPQNHGNESKSCADKEGLQSAVDCNDGGVYQQMSERASAMFAEYNATWDELESRLNGTDLKDVADAVQVPFVASASLIDFDISQPEFRIRRL